MSLLWVKVASEPGSDHEVLYHLTDKANFKPDVRHVPEDNAISIRERTRPGLFLTKHPEGWVNGHGYARPFVAEVHVPHGLAQNERWGGEKFVPAEHLDKVKVHRVIPLDAYAREEYGSHGWIEEHHGTEFDTGKPIQPTPWGSPVSAMYPFRGYHYDGPDVREMPKEQVAEHRRRARAFQRSLGQ